jgi:HAE1 family hydrophobic/amphiphilic exporter-1
MVQNELIFYAIIQTPPGSSLERTNDISVKLQK